MTSYEVTVVGKPEFQPYAQASCKDRRPLKELHNCIALTADTVHYCPTFDSSLATEIVGDKPMKLTTSFRPFYILNIQFTRDIINT